MGGIIKKKRENAQVTSIWKETEVIAIVPTDVKKIKIYNFMPMNLKIKGKIPRKKKHTPNVGIKESASIILNLPTEKLQVQMTSSVNSFEI